MATVALTREQYSEIIETIKQGTYNMRPNERVAAALTIEANLGIRISDVVKLRLCDIVHDAGRYRLDITEQKTGKKRTFTVPAQVYAYLQDYAIEHGIAKKDRLFPITTREIQKVLAKAADYLDLENISTHSFRKFFASEIYKATGYNIVLVQQLLQHSSAAVTQRYIGIAQQELEAAIEGHICL